MFPALFKLSLLLTLGVALSACSPSEPSHPATPAEQNAMALANDKTLLQQTLQDLKKQTDDIHQQILIVIREPDSPQKTQKIWQLMQQAHQKELTILQSVKLQHNQAQLSWQTLLHSTENMANLAGKIAAAYTNNDTATGNQLEIEYGKYNTQYSQAIAELEQLIKN